MKKLTIGVFVVILSVSAFLYFKKEKQVDNLAPDTNTKKYTENTASMLTEEKKMGNMAFDFAKENIISFNSNDSVVVDFKQKLKKYDLKDYSIKKENFYIGFSLSKNANPKKLTIEKWFEGNNPEEEKQSAYSAVTKEAVVVGGVPSYKVRYSAHIQLTGGFYDLITLYVPHGGDVYEVSYYAVPTVKAEPQFTLTPDDIKEATEYSQIVDRIVESIKFTN